MWLYTFVFIGFLYVSARVGEGIVCVRMCVRACACVVGARAKELSRACASARVALLTQYATLRRNVSCGLYAPQ
jgi:hypothetical protein